MKQNKKIFIFTLMIISFFFCKNVNALSTHITKTETNDYYLYDVVDNERNLTYSWKFLKEENKNISVEENMYIDNDLRLSLDASTKDTKRINEKVKNDKLIITFDYHGMLPLEAKVKIDVSDKFNDGEKLYLYYYNTYSANTQE